MEDSESGSSSLDRGRREPEMEHSESRSSSLDKGKRETEMEDSESKGRTEPEKEDFNSGPSSPYNSYKGRREPEIKDESDLSEQEKAVTAIITKMEDQRMEDRRVKDQSLAARIDKKLIHQPDESVERPCIYTVHEKFSRISEYAYTPETVSIGPVHHGKKILPVMEDIKERYMDTFLLRTGKRLETLQDCVKSIRDLIEIARKCYSEHIHCDDTTFTIMMIIDGLFIIEFLLRGSDLVTDAPFSGLFIIDFSLFSATSCYFLA